MTRSYHLANPDQYQSDDEDGTDTSSANSETSTREDSPHFPTSSRAAQRNQARWSSGPRIELNAEDNINISGKQIAGNVTASSLPPTGRFVINSSNNLNGGKLQNVGNVVFRNVNLKKMSGPSKKSHKKRFFTDIGSHSRNLKRHQSSDEMTSRVVPEPNASSESYYPPAPPDPSQGESSRRAVSQEIKDNKSSKGVQELGNIKLEKTSAIAFFDGGGEVSQTIVGNSNEGEVQRIGNIETFKGDVDHDAR